jgi:hypothetical protein
MSTTPFNLNMSLSLFVPVEMYNKPTKKLPFWYISKLINSFRIFN